MLATGGYNSERTRLPSPRRSRTRRTDLDTPATTGPTGEQPGARTAPCGRSTKPPLPAHSKYRRE